MLDTLTPKQYILYIYIYHPKERFSPNITYGYIKHDVSHMCHMSWFLRCPLNTNRKFVNEFIDKRTQYVSYTRFYKM